MSETIHFEILPPAPKPRKWPKPNVAADRYRKQIHEADLERADGQYAKAGLSGAAIGALVRKPGVKLGKAAAIGAGAGIAAQALVRTITEHHRDRFGDRRYNAKRVDSALPIAGEVAAAGLGYRKITKALRGARSVVGMASLRKDGIEFSAMDDLKRILGGGYAARLAKSTAVGAGALGVAGAVSGVISPDKGQTRTQSAASGLVKDGIFGGALYGATEPLLKKALNIKILASSKGAVIRLSAREIVRSRLMLFGGADQMRGSGRRFVDPLDVASGNTKAYTTDEHGNESEVHVGVSHAQVVRAALNKGRTLHRYGKRGAALGSDAIGALAGRRKVDERGRPAKREWEKSWFKNAVGTAAVAGGLLTHAHIMKKNPGYRKTVQGAIIGAKHRANKIIPDLFPLPKEELAARVRLLCLQAKVRSQIICTVTTDSRGKLIGFDAGAAFAGWDVRDPRGRSARVFAPGARRRERRDKQWHERVDNIRKVAVIGAGAALAGGTLLGWKLAKRSAAKSIIRPKAGEAFIPKVVPKSLSSAVRLIRFEQEKKTSTLKRAAVIGGVAVAGGVLGMRTLPRLISRGRLAKEGESLLGKVVYTHQGLTTPAEVMHLPGGVNLRRALHRAAKAPGIKGRAANAAMKVDDFLGVPQRHYAVGVGSGRVAEVSKTHGRRVIPQEQLAGKIHVEGDGKILKEAIPRKIEGRSGTMHEHEAAAFNDRFEKAQTDDRWKRKNINPVTTNNCESYARGLAGQGFKSNQVRAMRAGFAGGALAGGAAAALAQKKQKRELAAAGKLMAFSRRDPEERLRDRMTIAKNVALTGAGVAGIGAAGVLAYRGSKAIASLQKRGAALARGLHKTANTTVRDVITHDIKPAVEQMKSASANVQHSTAVYADVGKVWKGAKGGLYNVLHPKQTLRETMAAYREGRHGVTAPVTKPRPKWTQ